MQSVATAFRAICGIGPIISLTPRAMRGVQVCAFILLVMLGSPVRAEVGGRTVAADPGLAFGDWGERVTLDLPPAARGTKPDVSLVASHHAKDTEVGSGWRLQATSVIRRRSLTNGVPTLSTVMSESLFQIDGMDFVSVTGPGGAHYQPETYDGSRFDYNATFNTWTRKRDGWTWTYGDASAGATRSIHSFPFFPTRPCNAAEFCNTESWFLRTVVDPFNNRIDYTYSVPVTPSAFKSQYPDYPSSKEHLLSTITYGAGTVTINFTYKPRPDLGVDLSGGMPVFRHRRLKEVRSMIGTTTMYSHYVLQYEDEAESEEIIGQLTDCNNVPATPIAAPKHSLLRKVHRTGDKVTEPQRVIRCNKYHHEVIEWETGQQLANLIPNPFNTIPFIPKDNSWKLMPVELDGDGRTDLILLGYIAHGPIPPPPSGGVYTATPHQVFIATPNRADPFVGAGGADQASLLAQSWQDKLRSRLGTSIWTGRKGHAVVDITGDSIPELITEGGGTALIEQAYGSGVLSWDALSNHLHDCDLRYGEFSDVDGDGRVDVIVRAHGADGSCSARHATRWIRNTGPPSWFDSATYQPLYVPLEAESLPQAWTTAVGACPSGVTPPSDYYADADGNGIHDDWTVEGYVADQARFYDVNNDGILDVSYSLYACWTNVEGRWTANSNSKYSRIFFGKGHGTFIDSGLSAGPPLLLDTVNWGATGNTRITTGTFSMADLDRDGHSELLQSTFAVDGLGIGARSYASMAPPGPLDSAEDVGFHVSEDALLVPDPLNPLVTSFVGQAWDCNAHTVTPTWGDFDGDGFVDLLTINENWAVLLKRSTRKVSEGRMIETDNEDGGRIRLTWGFSAQLPNSNPDLPVNLEVIQRVTGPGGTRTMTYRGGVRRGDQVTAFEEVTVAGDRGGIEAYSFIMSPYAMGKQHFGVRYRENGSVEHVTSLTHGQMYSFGFYLSLARPYFNPLVRRCEYDVGFGAVDLDQLDNQCRDVPWLAPDIAQTGGFDDSLQPVTDDNYRRLLGHDRLAESSLEQATFAKVWGVSTGSRVLPPRFTTTAPEPFQQSFAAAVSAAAAFFATTAPANAPGFYWPLPQTLFGRLPDVIGQETAYQYPLALFESPNVYVWDYGYDHPVRKLAVRYEHRDLSTTDDDRRVDFTWEQPFSNGYWYRLLFETTNDSAGNRLARLERSDFVSSGFDAPQSVKHCGLNSPADCRLDKYTYFTNGTLKEHFLPDNSSESWTRLAWCGEPLTHTDSANRVTTFTRDSRCLNQTVKREGATTTFTYDSLLRPIKVVADPGAGVSETKVTRSFYYDDAPTYQAHVDAREDYIYQQPRRAERRGDGQLELIYKDGLGRTTRRTRCADAGTNTTGGPMSQVGCASGSRRHLEWNLYGTDGLLKVATAPFEDLETPTTTGYGHDGQNRPIIVMGPVHEPGQIAWRVDTIKYGAGYEERVEPTATGVTTTRRVHSTLGESLIAAGVVRRTTTRDRLGLVTSLTEADGKITRLDYDTQYRLASERRVDAAGQPVREHCLMPDGTTQLRPYIHTITARDARGRVTGETLPDGSVLTYAYDNADRILQRQVNGTTVRSYTYTAPTVLAKGMVRVTDELGGMSSTVSVDGLGRIWSRTAARVNDQWTYDTTGRVTTMANVDNLVTQYFYNIQDNVTSVIDPRTGTTTYKRDGSGRLTSIVDADGATDTFSYTYSGAPYQRYRGSGLMAERAYDPRGQVVNSVDDGVVKAITYDPLGRLTKLREGVNGGNALRVTEYVYDAGDHVTNIVRSPVGGVTATTSIHYDDWGRPYEVVDPYSKSISREFDAAGRVRRVTDQEGATLETKYDMFGRITDFQVPGAGWRHTRYFGRQTYDGEPNLWRIERYDDETRTASDKIQRYTDGTGHTLAELRPDGSSMKWIWSTGRVSRQEIRSGAAAYRATDFHYDANGRLDRETRGPYVLNHQYTSAGRLWRTTTPDDTLERTYEQGLLATQSQAGVRHRFLRGATQTWVIGEQSQRGTGPVRDTGIHRDGLGRIDHMVISEATQTGPVLTRTFSFFDYYGNPWLEQSAIGPTNVAQWWVYDRKGRPVSRHTSGTGLPGKQTIWSWYDNDVLAAVQTPSNKVLTYNYGPTFDHQLDDVKLDGTIVAQINTRNLRGLITSMTLPLPVAQTRTFGYDPMGRTHKRTSGPLAPAATDFEWNASFHPDGKLATDTIQDNTVVDGWTNKYEYDAAGRLVHEVAGKTDTIYDYVLDAAGNRLATNVTPAATGVTTAPMNATYDGPKLVSVNTVPITYNEWNEVSADHHGNTYTRTVDGELVAITNAGATTVFVRDARAVPIAALEAGGMRRTAWDLSAGLPLEVEEAGGTVLTYVKVDGMHVGTAENGVLTGMTTDNRETELKHGGQVLGALTSFGVGTVAPNNSDERFMFAMLERVPSASEVMLARRRTYDPTTGRFLEPDPIGAAGGLQLYQYGHGDPVNFVDPMGMAAIGADCSTPGNPPIIHVDPIRTQIYEMLGMDAPPSMYDVIAGSSLGQIAYLTSLAEGSQWILDADVGSNNPFPNGPLCVVNCAQSSEGKDKVSEEITVYGKRFDEITVYGKRFEEVEAAWGSNPNDYDRDVPIVVTGDEGKKGGNGDGGFFKFFKKLFGGLHGGPTTGWRDSLAEDYVRTVEVLREADRSHGLVRTALYQAVEQRERNVARAIDATIARGPTALAGAALQQFMRPPAQTAVEMGQGLLTLGRDYLSSAPNMISQASAGWTVDNEEDARRIASDLLDDSMTILMMSGTVASAVVGAEALAGEGAVLDDLGGGPVHLYRAVSDEELADVQANGFRSGGPATMETKLFTTTPQFGGAFARLLYQLTGQPSTLLRVRIPQSIAKQLDYFTADGMPAVAVYPELLPAFNEAAAVEIMSFIPIQ
jgi:RHS repeat-associated protein